VQQDDDMTDNSERRANQSQQRTVVVMFDGLGLDYYRQSPLPTLKSWAETGLFAEVDAVLPTVTNANNASICCGAWPSVHGVIGNSYLDEETGEEEYLEDSALLRAPTLFERAAAVGVRSALLTSKKKTTSLLGSGTEILLAAEVPEGDWEKILGKAPPIYSREINYWLLRAAIHILRTRPEIGCLYVHTTDYAMHEWAPAAPESQEHVATIDALLREAAEVAPDAAFLVSADHGMNYKSRCWDLDKACAMRGLPIRIAISAERDKYLRHHRGFGGMAWVYVQKPEDIAAVKSLLLSLDGVASVLTRTEAVEQLHLMPERIGDLVVEGDRDTVFGHLDTDVENLPPSYRSHGCRHELGVPLILHNAKGAPGHAYFRNNLDLARWLYPLADVEVGNTQERDEVPA
jgi:phosphonoacetate hydrolase